MSVCVCVFLCVCVFVVVCVCAFAGCGSLLLLLVTSSVISMSEWLAGDDCHSGTDCTFCLLLPVITTTSS